MNSVRLYLTNAASSVATRILQITVLVWVNQYLLRRIEPAEYSIFPIVLSLMFFADVFKNMITGGIGRFIVEADSRNDEASVTRIVSSIFPIVLVAAFIFAIAGVTAAWQADNLLNIKADYLPQARIMLLLLTFSLCLNVIAAPFSDGAYVRQRFVILNLIDLGAEALRITILLFLLFGVSTKVMWLVVASSCASAVNLFARVMITRRWIPAIRFRKELFCQETAKTLIRFGGWTSIQGITSLVSSTAPILLLNRFATPIDVSSFHLGRLPETQIRALAGVASSPAQPALTRIYATKGEGSLDDLYYRGGRYFLWVALLLIAPLLVFGKQAIELYTRSQQYASAFPVMFALLAVYPFLWASGMFFQVAHAIGRIGAYYICDVVVQIVTLLALFYAVGHRGLGAPGAAMAVGLVGGILHIFLIWPMGLRLVNGQWNRFIRQTILPGILPFVFAVAVCYGFDLLFQMQSWFMICLGSATALSVYFAVTILFCLDPLDRSLVARLVGRIRNFLPASSVRPT